MDVERRIDDGEGEREQPSELEEARAEHVDVCLQDVGEVDEQVRRLFTSTDGVETRGDDMLRAAALNEVVLHREHEEALGRLLVVLCQPKRLRQL